MASENNSGGAGDMDADLPLDFEEDLAGTNSSAHDSMFDATIGHIEDIIMEEEFHTIQNGFLEKYYKEFDDTEENKFIYSDVHTEYINIIEIYLGNELTKRMPEFSMINFQKQLIERKDELDGEVFEMLLTFSDFLSFKEMVLDYKNEKEGNTIDLSSGLCVRSLSQQNADSSTKNTPNLLLNGTASSASNNPASSHIRNLDIGGQSVMIGMPGGASNNIDMCDFSVSGQSLIGAPQVQSTEQMMDSTSPRDMDEQ